MVYNRLNSLTKQLTSVAHEDKKIRKSAIKDISKVLKDSQEHRESFLHDQIYDLKSTTIDIVKTKAYQDSQSRSYDGIHPKLGLVERLKIFF